MYVFLSPFGGTIQEIFYVLDDDSFVIKEKHMLVVFIFG